MMQLRRYEGWLFSVPLEVKYLGFFANRILVEFSQVSQLSVEDHQQIRRDLAQILFNSVEDFFTILTILAISGLEHDFDTSVRCVLSGTPYLHVIH